MTEHMNTADGDKDAAVPDWLAEIVSEDDPKEADAAELQQFEASFIEKARALQQRLAKPQPARFNFRLAFSVALAILVVAAVSVPLVLSRLPGQQIPSTWTPKVFNTLFVELEPNDSVEQADSISVYYQEGKGYGVVTGQIGLDDPEDWHSLDLETTEVCWLQLGADQNPEAEPLGMKLYGPAGLDIELAAMQTDDFVKYTIAGPLAAGQYSVWLKAGGDKATYKVEVFTE